MGLQEVDELIAKSFMDPLTEFGYQHIYRKRPGGKDDGCVIAWKKERFTLGKMPKVIDFNQEAMNFTPELYLPEKEYRKWNIGIHCELVDVKRIIFFFKQKFF